MTALEHVNLGQAPGDGRGDTLRDAGAKINAAIDAAVALRAVVADQAAIIADLIARLAALEAGGPVAPPPPAYAPTSGDLVALIV